MLFCFTFDIYICSPYGFNFYKWYEVGIAKILNVTKHHFLKRLFLNELQHSLHHKLDGWVCVVSFPSVLFSLINYSILIPIPHCPTHCRFLSLDVWYYKSSSFVLKMALAAHFFYFHVNLGISTSMYTIKSLGFWLGLYWNYRLIWDKISL